MSGHTDHTRQAAIEATAQVEYSRWVSAAEQHWDTEAESYKDGYRKAVAPIVDAVLGVVPPPPDLAPLHALADRLRVYADARHSRGHDLEGNAYLTAEHELRAALAALPAVHEDCATAGRCTRLAPPATPQWGNEAHPPAPHQNGR